MNSPLQKLNAVLRMYESNFRILHWNAKGIDFNDSHKSITTEYYEMIGKTIDQIAEIMARLGENVPNYVEVLNILKSDNNKDYMIIDPSDLYTREQIVKLADTMLNDICLVIIDCLEDPSIQNLAINAGIKSELESIYSEYDLQARYINKRRLM
jgi:DNA-binding ferritin-like protein